MCFQYVLGSIKWILTIWRCTWYLNYYAAIVRNLGRITKKTLLFLNWSNPIFCLGFAKTRIWWHCCSYLRKLTITSCSQNFNRFRRMSSNSFDKSHFKGKGIFIWPFILIEFFFYFFIFFYFQIKTVKLTVVVVAGYLVCSAPFVCVQLYAVFGNPDPSTCKEKLFKNRRIFKAI